MNIIITFFKSILSRAEMVIYLANLDSLSQFHLEDILIAINYMEKKRTKLEDLTYINLESAYPDDRHLIYIKITLAKVITILTQYLNTRGCRLDEDKKLQKHMLIMPVEKILQQFSQQTIVALNEQVNLLKAKKQLINSKTYSSNYQTNLLNDMKQLQCKYLLDHRVCLDTYSQVHLTQLLQVDFIESQSIYSWVLRTFRVCQNHIDENNLKLEIQEERYILVTDYITKRNDIIFKDLMDRNSYIAGEIQKYITSQYKEKVKVVQEVPQMSQVYYTQSSHTKKFKIKKVTAETSRVNLFCDTLFEPKLVPNKPYHRQQIKNLDSFNLVSPVTNSVSHISSKLFHTTRGRKSMEKKMNILSFIEIPVKQLELKNDLRTVPIIITKPKQQIIIPRSSSNFLVDSLIQNNSMNLTKTMAKFYCDSRSSSHKTSAIINGSQSALLKQDQTITKSLNLLKFHIFQHGRTSQK